MESHQYIFSMDTILSEMNKIFGSYNNIEILHEANIDGYVDTRYYGQSHTAHNYKDFMMGRGKIPNHLVLFYTYGEMPWGGYIWDPETKIVYSVDCDSYEGEPKIFMCILNPKIQIVLHGDDEYSISFNWADDEEVEDEEDEDDDDIPQ
jgi:hypothetical protein